MLGQLRPECALTQAIRFACVVAGAGIAIIGALSGRTLAGTIVLVVVLIGYGYVVMGNRYGGYDKMAEKPAVHYTIDLSGVNVDGAELWVNGVYLGKTPYIATVDEFISKVPYWPEQPKDYDTDNVAIPEYQQDGVSASTYYRWIKFQSPVVVWAGSLVTPLPLADWRTYYARVRYAGEWGLHGGGGGGGMTNYYADSEVNVFFPERQKRLDALLNKARLTDYRVWDDWYKAMETYNEDGWIALDNAVGKEPGMKKVMDDWASRRYQLDKVVDEESAWQTFQRICDEAKSREWYLTASLAGHAVEILVPKLPQDRLVEKTVKIIRNSDTFDYTQWTLNGRLVFGINQGPGFVSLGKAGSMYNSGSVEGQFPVSGFPVNGFPVAHAIWKLNDRLVAEKAASPNIIQLRIVPEIIRRFYRKPSSDAPMLIATHFGGPAIDTLLQRQSRHFDRLNLWDDISLYYIVYLKDEVGQKYRHDYAWSIMSSADWRCEKTSSLHDLPDQIDFIFVEPWLAKEYWPHFAKLIRQEPSSERLIRQKQFFNPLKTQWQYLLKMGDSAMPEMFVEAWKETKINFSDFMFSVQLLKQLDRKTQQNVVDSLVEEIQINSSNLVNVPENLKKEMIRQLQTPSGEHDPQLVFETLEKGPQADRDSLMKYLPLWLEHNEPASHLVDMLAKADDPKLRALALGAVRANPTPEHQALLQQLLNDPDSTVREAAEKVSKELKVLAEADPREYASDYSSAAEKAPPAK
ncbi:MAG: hypothetical protein ABSA26_16330 [Thermoguttaceae bacterium]|jgi:hypothetical protein